jgi:hypothetical protein
VTKGELDNAIRRALNILDIWNDVTGAVPKGSGWYYELQKVVEDAVHCGAQAECHDYKLLEVEHEQTALEPNIANASTEPLGEDVVVDCVMTVQCSWAGHIDKPVKNISFIPIELDSDLPLNDGDKVRVTVRREP